VPAAVAALEAILPDAQALELTGLDHFGPNGSRADRIAGILADFFVAEDDASPGSKAPVSRDRHSC
jgi:hypothetical protein